MKYNYTSAKGGSAGGGSKIIIANWKMNLSIKESLLFVKNLKLTKNKAVIAAPFTFLPALNKAGAGKKIALSAQDVSSFEKGAYTGEVSAKMLKEVGCSYCLVGHSERRIYFQETDKVINQKILQLLKYKISPVLCIGENASQRRNKATKNVLKKQLILALKSVKDPAKILIAYEPIWAISTFQKGKNKQAAQLSDITAAHLYIKSVLKDIYGAKAAKVKILYGGTVNPQNAKAILSLKEVAGALVGGASLKFSSFNAIIRAI